MKRSTHSKTKQEKGGTEGEKRGGGDERNEEKKERNELSREVRECTEHNYIMLSMVIRFGKTQSPFVLKLKLTIYSDCYRHLLVEDRVDTFAMALFTSKNLVNGNFKMVL